MSRLKPILLRWAPALLIMVVIFIASATPSAEIPQYGALDTLVKKAGHFTIYALLAAACLWGQRGANPRQVAIALLIATTYAITDETHQMFTPGRHTSPADVGIDTLGALFGVTMYRIFMQLHKGFQKPGRPAKSP